MLRGAGAGVAGRQEHGGDCGNQEAEGHDEIGAFEANVLDADEHAGQSRADNARAVHIELLEDDGVAAPGQRGR